MATVQADLVLNIDEALSQIEALGDLISDVTSNVAVSVDTSEAEVQIQALDDEQVEVPVDADVSAAEGQIEGLDADTVEVPVEADTSEAEADISGLDADTVVVPVEADVSSAEGDIGALDGESVTVTVEANTEGAQESISGLTDQVEGLGGAGGSAATELTGLNTAMSGASIQGAAAAIGIGAVATAGTAAVLAFADAESTVAIATQVIENLGDSSGVTVEGLQALATNLQQTAGFSDEAVISAGTLIARFGTLNNRVGEGNDIFDRTILLSADVATALGTDITSAAELLGKAVANPEAGVGRLARRFPQLTEAIQNNIVEMQQSGDLLGAQRLLLDTLAGSVDGVADAYGQTLAGKIDIAKESIGEVAETIGGLLAPAVTDMATDIADAATNVQALIETFQGWGEAISGAVDILPGFGDALGLVFETLNDMFLGGAIDAFNELSTAITGADKTAVQFDQSMKPIPPTLQAVTDAQEVVAGAATAVDEAIAAEEQAWDDLVNAFLSNAPSISTAIQEVEGNLNGFGETIDSETDAQMVIDNFGQMIDAFQDFATNIDTIGNVSSSVAEALAPLGPEIAGGFVQALADGRPGLITQLEGMLAEAEGSGIDMVDLFGLTASDSVAAVEDGLSGLTPTTRSATRDSVAAVRAERDSALQAGTFLGNSFTTGTRQGSRDMRVKTKESAREAIDAVRNERDAAGNAGDALGTQFSIGTRRGARDMRPNSREATNSAIDGVKELTQTAFRGGERVGENLASGIAAGISSGTSAVTSAAIRIVNAAASAANAAARSSSPSKVFEEIGWNMSEGMAIGLADSASVVAAAEALTLAAADASAGGTVYGDSNVSVTVDARGATDPQAVGDAVGQAVEDAMFRAAVAGGRRRR